LVKNKDFFGSGIGFYFLILIVLRIVLDTKTALIEKIKFHFND